MININLTSTFKITKAAVKGMVKRRYGRVINITSVIGVLGGAGQANYSASKAAIIGMSKSLAQELGSRSITVNCIAPGFVETNMTAKLDDSRKDEILKSIVLYIQIIIIHCRRSGMKPTPMSSLPSLCAAV